MLGFMVMDKIGKDKSMIWLSDCRTSYLALIVTPVAVTAVIFAVAMGSVLLKRQRPADKLGEKDDADDGPKVENAKIGSNIYRSAGVSRHKPVNVLGAPPAYEEFSS